jgi:steroid delta-isomerase-like uncharacterized protein
MSSHKETVQRHIQRINNRNLTAADCAAIFAPDYVETTTPPVSPGPEGQYALYQATLAGFPDFRIVVDDLIEEDDRVVVRWTFTGTRQGEFNGIPATGKQAKLMGISIWHFDEQGRNVHEYELLDGLGMLAQMGVLPAPEPAAA